MLHRSLCSVLHRFELYHIPIAKVLVFSPRAKQSRCAFEQPFSRRISHLLRPVFNFTVPPTRTKCNSFYQKSAFDSAAQSASVNKASLSPLMFPRAYTPRLHTCMRAKAVSTLRATRNYPYSSAFFLELTP